MNSLGRDRFRIAEIITTERSSAHKTPGCQVSLLPSQGGVGARLTFAGSRAYSRAGLCDARTSWLLGKSQTTARNRRIRLLAFASLKLRPATEREKPCVPDIEPRSFSAVVKLSARKNTQAAITARKVTKRPAQMPAAQGAPTGAPLRSRQACHAWNTDR